jgi:FKBP-type peptidyl-prolyl cis-trans isomerase FkpA
MKKLVLPLLALSVVLFACKKNQDNCPYSDSAVTAPASEITYMQKILADSGYIATQHSSGVFYSIITPGTGTNPGLCSTITVKYTGSLLSNGNVFDSNTGTTGTNFTLGSLVVGWQKAMPLLKNGGKIILYIPPSLGYGAQHIRDQYNQILIPANSYLKFQIELTNVQ